MLAQPRMTAAKAFWIVSRRRERRLAIEAALERLDGLRDRLIGRLDQLDGDPDLESWLGASDAVDQRHWARCSRDDREAESDFEPEDFHACNWPDVGDQTRLVL